MQPAWPLAFLGLGDSEILVVMVVVLIFFGGKRMPELARGLGKMLREFRRATSDVEREFKRMMDETERQTIAPLRDAMQVPPGTLPTNPSIFGAETAVTSGLPVSPPPAEAAATPPVTSPSPPAPSPAPAPSSAAPAWPLPAPYVPPATHRLQPDRNDDEFHSDI